MKMLSLFAHPHIVPDVYDFLSLKKKKKTFVEKYQSLRVYNASERLLKCLCSTKHTQSHWAIQLQWMNQ